MMRDTNPGPGVGGNCLNGRVTLRRPPAPSPHPSMIYIKTISDKVLTSRARGMETFKSRYPSNEVTGD